MEKHNVVDPYHGHLFGLRKKIMAHATKWMILEDTLGEISQSPEIKTV